MVGASKSVSPWSCDEFKYITLGIKDDYKYVFLRGGGHKFDFKYKTFGLEQGCS